AVSTRVRPWPAPESSRPPGEMSYHQRRGVGERIGRVPRRVEAGMMGPARGMEPLSLEAESAAGDLGAGRVTWRIGRENALLLGGGRATLMQLAHPLVAAGVGQHSSYSSDPWGRLYRTLEFTQRMAFGDVEDARDAAHAVNRLHLGVTGRLPSD